MGSIKMIVTDMDATLLRDDKTISAYSLEVFAKCRARGLDIVLATARAYRNCLHKGYVQDVSPFGGIYNDGAQVLVGDREIYAKKYPMKPQSVSLEFYPSRSRATGLFWTALPGILLTQLMI